MELAAGSANGPKRVHLELGGKAPFVVFDDADLDAAVQGAVAGALINTGQDCTAATRAYVQRPLYDAFVAGVADLMGTVVLGDPLDGRTDQGPLVSRAPAGAGRRLRRPRPPRRGQGRERRRGAGWRAGPRRLLRAHPGRRRRPGVGDRPGRGVRPGPRRAALRRRRRGPAAGQRHAVRPGGVGLDPRRVPRRCAPPARSGQDASGSTTTSRSSARCRTAATRPRGTARTCPSTRSRSTRTIKHVMYDGDGSGPQGLAPHRLHRHHRPAPASRPEQTAPEVTEETST